MDMRRRGDASIAAGCCLRRGRRRLAGACPGARCGDRLAPSCRNSSGTVRPSRLGHRALRRSGSWSSAAGMSHLPRLLDEPALPDPDDVPGVHRPEPGRDGDPVQRHAVVALALVYDREVGTMRLMLTAPLPRWRDPVLQARRSGPCCSVIQSYASWRLGQRGRRLCPWQGWLLSLPVPVPGRPDDGRDSAPPVGLHPPARELRAAR